MKITFNKKTIKLILDKLSKLDKDYYENFNFNESKTIQNLLRYCDSDTDIIGDIVNVMSCPDEMMEILISLGYTHTLDNIEPEDKTITHYIVYDLKAIKIIKKEKI